MFKRFFTSTKFSPSLTAKIAALEARLADIAGTHVPATLVSRLSPADMVITHVILRRSLDISVVALDTGDIQDDRLNLIKAVCDNYRYAITTITPASGALAGKGALISTAAVPPAFEAGHGVREFQLLSDWSGQEIHAYLTCYKVPHIGSPACGTKNGEALKSGAWWRAHQHFSDIV